VNNDLLLRAFVKVKTSTSERGATAVEYGLIVALIAAIIIGLLRSIGASTGFGFGSFNSEYDTYKP
jgi:pilus assembly protein Flp/PilA